ncbi:F-actin-capping protein [Apophysomyces ossiformis]|uniref:F-actin-capping protein subunit alpha n=1 Tax=Apophysomyces ossiformis TaxID=679940 RepID=A0A8H7BUQ6_9FUNG|nr:F-actin-capping protein [Apophysomyces ossiformis]
MEPISVEEKVAIASKFLLFSPPGEVNDVFNDVRTLVDNDEALQDGILNALEQYNTQQHITVQPPDLEYEVIVSQYGKVDQDRFLDPRSHKSFKFDHMRLTASDLEDHEIEQSIEELRVAVDTEVQAYVADHYPNGVCTVYGVNSEEIAICIVDNKYNPHNYWNGRWLSSWTYSTQTGALKGTAKVNVHYYEEGNVQLSSEKGYEATVASDKEVQQTAAAILKELAAFDKRYHNAINNSYNELSENTFKGLRRALPLTRHKLDWNKILNYKIGSELTQK